MKRRHLQGLGWRVVNVPYITWDGLPDDAARLAYLRGLIQQEADGAREAAARAAGQQQR